MEAAEPETRADRAWLLHSRANPQPIAGALTLADGRLRFALDETATDAELDWLERTLRLDGIAATLAAGDEVVAFDHPLSDCVITWPITGGGALMIVRVADRKWVIAHEDPSNPPVTHALRFLGGLRKAREWKRALVQAAPAPEGTGS